MLKQIEGKIVDYDNEIAILKTGALTLETYPSFNIIKNSDKNKLYNFYCCFELNEWSMSMYLFWDEKERNLFLNLKKVSKLGAKSASKILRTNNADKIISMISAKDIKELKKLPGIGLKTAERIISELKEKYENMSFNDYDENTDIKDAVEALVSLGFEKHLVLKIINDNNLEKKKAEEVIKFVLSKF